MFSSGRHRSLASEAASDDEFWHLDSNIVTMPLFSAVSKHRGQDDAILRPSSAFAATKAIQSSQACPNPPTPTPRAAYSSRDWSGKIAMFTNIDTQTQSHVCIYVGKHKTIVPKQCARS